MAFLDYTLPPDLIAQQPAPERDRSRLLVVRRVNDSLEHRHFLDLPDLLDAGDLLVLNDTRVLPARLLGRRERTGGKWEGLYLGERDGIWEMLCQLRGRLVEGEFVIVGEPVASAAGVLIASNPPGADAPASPAIRLQFVGRSENGHFLFRPESPTPAVDQLTRFGHVPLPPYIRKGRSRACDAERYQTVYARQPGAVAAPTAGLHFTDRVFERLRDRGIEETTLTLHVGLGTFQPLQSDDLTKHVMHGEWCELPAGAADAVNACRTRGKRVVAVGTTVVRTLESAAGHNPGGPLFPWSGESDLFIYPPYNFRKVDALVTNFHLPRTSLLLLVAAFAGEELIRRAYEEAIARRYRFYSYGDAMLIL
ncbi:MAG TPA: tRNA preQ1(34) S-adenosylmethionine ribosyltransferase-isomerase QueA [Gemmataceae bacterium]|jgi:S-adenosylmethionine:tRNA ribosyltransferase-isomerase|nr:tRNA preQ1(34) S-adenosylmethionine ribosyltransferase-isomerase QueA [Gemmataceae bacterium]